MFLTPVLYPTPTAGFAGVLVALNPLTPLVVNTRDWLTLGTTTNLAGFVAVTITMTVVLLASWVTFRVALPHLVARFGN
jgi:lipopolysaccharide transport system permease protein